MASAIVGALAGAVVGYLFLTERGKAMRDRFEPSMDDLRREFGKFQHTLERMGEMATEGIRAVQGLQSPRSQARRSTEPMSH
jgi:gas vesicle protein